MVMKIIRHSRKIFVYSLPLLLYLQHLSCTPPIESHENLNAILNQHGNAIRLYDKLQTAFGRMDPDNTLALDPNKDIPKQQATLKKTKAQYVDQLIEMTSQYLTFEAKMHVWSENYTKEKTTKEANKKSTRNNFIDQIRYGEGCYSQFNPPMTDFNHLPLDQNFAEPLLIVRKLQDDIGQIIAPPNEDVPFFSTTVAAVKTILSKMHNFFDQAQPCCAPLSSQSPEELNHLIFLRARFIPWSLGAKLMVYNQGLERGKRQQALTYIPPQLPNSQNNNNNNNNALPLQGPPPSYTTKPYNDENNTTNS
jgi:hypothetical protein